jgi:Fur family ferric uptake transcriptional regulator
MTHNFDLPKVEVSLTPLQRFEEFLQSRGKRTSKQRRMIVEEVFRQHEHFDADHLSAQLARSGSDVSRPTVYRTLNELVEAGLLRRMTLGGRSVYEHDYGYPQHDHLYCQQCERLIEFHSEELQRIREAVAREHQFRVTSHRFTIFGTCAQCAKPRRRVRRLELV